MAQSADETALRRLVERYYAAFVNNDLKTLLSVMSQESPELAELRNDFVRLAELRIELKSLIVEKITVEGDKGVVSVLVNRAMTHIKTGVQLELGKPS